MKTGDLFYLSEGAYSAYQVTTHLRALKDFSVKDMAKQYMDTEVMPSRYSPCASVFGQWLVKQGVAEEVDNINEVHCGDYDFTNKYMPDV